MDDPNQRESVSRSPVPPNENEQPRPYFVQNEGLVSNGGVGHHGQRPILYRPLPVYQQAEVYLTRSPDQYGPRARMVNVTNVNYMVPYVRQRHPAPVPYHFDHMGLQNAIDSVFGTGNLYITGSPYRTRYQFGNGGGSRSPMNVTNVNFMVPYGYFRPRFFRHRHPPPVLYHFDHMGLQNFLHNSLGTGSLYLPGYQYQPQYGVDNRGVSRGNVMNDINSVSENPNVSPVNIRSPSPVHSLLDDSTGSGQNTGDWARPNISHGIPYSAVPRAYPMPGRVLLNPPRPSSLGPPCMQNHMIPGDSFPYNCQASLSGNNSGNGKLSRNPYRPRSSEPWHGTGGAVSPLYTQPSTDLPNAMSMGRNRVKFQSGKPGQGQWRPMKNGGHTHHSPSQFTWKKNNVATDHIKWDGFDQKVEPVGKNCHICKGDLAYSPKGVGPKIKSEPKNFADVAVFSCGHAFHCKCLELLVISEERQRDPPCCICAGQFAVGSQIDNRKLPQ